MTWSGSTNEEGNKSIQNFDGNTSCDTLICEGASGCTSRKQVSACGLDVVALFRTQWRKLVSKFRVQISESELVTFYLTEA